MSIADLIESMAAAGAPVAAIVLAVRELEEREAVDADRRAKAAERKRRERDRKRDCRATVAGQSCDIPPSPLLSPTPPNIPPISPQTTPDRVREPAIEQAPVSVPDHGTLSQELAEAAGTALVNPASSPGLLVLSDPMNWIRNGCDLEADILPAIRARCSRARPNSIRSWSYFTEAVYQARDTRMKPSPAPHETSHDRSARYPDFHRTAGHDAILAAVDRAFGINDEAGTRQVAPGADERGGTVLDFSSPQRASTAWGMRP